MIEPFWVNETVNRRISNIESAAGGSKEGIAIYFIKAERNFLRA